MAGMNQLPSGERIHIGVYGCRNAGKSSIVNALTGQDLSIVSEIPGTTTDPVRKSMELLPLGPVVILDTPGFDDIGELGEKRVLRTKRALNQTDLALLVVDAKKGLQREDELLLSLMREKDIPFLIVYNKCDLIDAPPEENENSLFVSAKNKENIERLKERIGELGGRNQKEKTFLSHLLKKGDRVVLVCPIDGSAPKGRIILPQQMAIREILDAGAIASVTREKELSEALSALKEPPDLVITDSQAFSVVASIVPASVPLTSFSILMAEYKGFLKTALSGIRKIKELKDKDRILVAEGCTHHRQCGDIGTVKIPKLLKKHTGKELIFDAVPGRDFPEDLSEYALIIHCGGCMLTERELRFREKCAADQKIPFTNYGLLLSELSGTLDRSLQILRKERKNG